MCHCEHKEGGMPNNGIMCGVGGKNFNLQGFCNHNERCTGPTKDDPATNFVPLKENFRDTQELLCTKGIRMVRSKISSIICFSIAKILKLLL